MTTTEGTDTEERKEDVEDVEERKEDEEEKMRIWLQWRGRWRRGRDVLMTMETEGREILMMTMTTEGRDILMRKLMTEEGIFWLQRWRIISESFRKEEKKKNDTNTKKEEKKGLEEQNEDKESPVQLLFPQHSLDQAKEILGPMSFENGCAKSTCIAYLIGFDHKHKSMSKINI